MNYNIASRLEERALATPNKNAILIPLQGNELNAPKYDEYTFKALNELTNQYANGLSEIGISKNMKVSFMVSPGADFLALTFALFKIGAVPVLIDPGMGLLKLFNCLKQVKPEVFIGIPIAQFLRQFKPSDFKSVKTYITVGEKSFFGGYSTSQLASSNKEFTMVETSKTDNAAILFTTGSTGPAKGVLYEHGMFDMQTNIIKNTYNIGPNDIDLPTFPLFALFSIAIGATVIIPNMNPAHPSKVKPEKIITPILNKNVTFSFGSPALWNTVSKYCIKHKIKLPSLKKILMAGAPVPADLQKRMFTRILSKNAEIHIPYGATEALPIVSFTGSEALKSTVKASEKGRGMCVGYPLTNSQIKIIKITDKAIEKWTPELDLPKDEIGEITVSGPIVTKEYYKLPEKTRFAKIKHDDKIIHRMGDIGYLDSTNRLWFCGRKAHRIKNKDKVYYSVCCEAIFNQHPNVYRSALVGLGKDKNNQEPVMFIEPYPEKFPYYKLQKSYFADELFEISQLNPLTVDIKKIYFNYSFPVDVRHNAKIFREKLEKWVNYFWMRYDYFKYKP